MDFLKSFLDPGTIIGIIGAIIGILGLWAGLKGKQAKVLEYQVFSTQIITNRTNNIPGLKIVVGDEFASDLISSKVVFTNRGNTTIEQKDFASLAPLKVITLGHFFNIETISENIIESKNPNLNPEIIVCDNKTIDISFEYLKPTQSFSITVLHDGKVDVVGDLVNGTIREYKLKNESIQGRVSHYVNFLMTCMGVILTTAAVLLSVWNIKLKQDLSNLESDYQQLHSTYIEMQLLHEGLASDVNSISQDSLLKLYYMNLKLAFDAWASAQNIESN